MASSQRTIDQATGTAPTIGIGVDFDERTHYAHARYAMSDEAGVIWYDPRDGREKFRVPNVADDTDLDLGERVLTHVTIHPKRAMCRVVDPEEHEWVVEYQVKTRELFERPPDVPDREYTAHYAGSETYDTVQEARSAAGDRCPAYADASYRNAVEARTEGELVTDGGEKEESEVYHDVTTGDWTEVEGGNESYRRMLAAQRLGCDKSDLRRGYDHSDREPENTDVADGVLRDALSDEDLVSDGGGVDHDAILRVFDATDRLGKNLVGWKWSDGRPTVSLDEHDEAESLIEEAEERIEPDEHEHGTVVARIWMIDEAVDRVEWQEVADVE